MNLFELSNEYRHLLMELEETDDEPTESVIAQLQAAEGDIHNKADGYCSLIGHYHAAQKAVEEEIERLQKRANHFSKRSTWLKDRLRAALEFLGETKIKTALNTISICQNGGAQPLTIQVRPEDLPEQFRKVAYEPNRDAIRRALKDGQFIPGCQLMERNSHLRIT